MRDELLNGEIFYTLKEARVLIEMWRKEYNTIRLYSSLGYRTPVSETILGPTTQSQQFVLTKRAVQIVGGCRRQVGGSIDTCHEYTAATIVDIGREVCWHVSNMADQEDKAADILGMVVMKLT